MKTFEDIKFNAERDSVEVTQLGVVNLVNAYDNNVIPSDLPPTEERFNGIEDPSAIFAKPGDLFDAVHIRETINGYKPSSNNPSGVEQA